MADGSVPQLFDEGRSPSDGRFVAGNPGGPGRPVAYTDEIGDWICELLKDGHTLIGACRIVGIKDSTARTWAANPNHPFFAKHAEARVIGYQRMADEVVEISDDSSLDLKTDEEGNERVNSEVVARSRLKVDTRKWLLAKALPKIYGDRVENRITGADGGALKVETNADPVAMARQIAYMLTRATAEPAVIENDEPEPT